MAHRRLMLMAFVLAGCCIGAPSEAAVDGITAIYNFGDSLSDTGNLLQQGGATGFLQHSTSLPYGVTIGRATGRCSDGYLMIDFLAKDLGLPLLNPYLDKGADFSNGVNFAVAGATALDTTTLTRRGVTIPHTNSSLGVQLGWFKEFMSSTGPPQNLLKIGGNEYNYAFVQTWPMDGGHGFANITHMLETIAKALVLVPEVVQSISDAARELLDMGAVRVVIPGNFPLGCVPSYLSAANITSSSAYNDAGCLIALNIFASVHNLWLQRAVAGLRRSYPSATVAYAAYLALLADARGLGFDADGGALQRACCGAGGDAYNFDVRTVCGAPGTTVCADPGRSVSWDGVHLTQHAYAALTELLFRGGFACPAPIRFPGQKECSS